MNYYPFHVGDYAAHTAHLEPMEDLAYRRMLDAYYLRESPLPSDAAEVARLVRMRSCVDAVQAVLDEFFVLTDSGWTHARCDAEIHKMQDKQAKAKASAEASVNARKAYAQRTLNERSTDVELPTPTPTPTPLTKVNTPRKARSSADASVSVSDLVSEGVDEQHAKDWMRVRKDKGAKTLTPTAWQSVKTEAEKAGLSVADAVRISAANSWQGFKASWLEQAARAGPVVKSTHTGFDSKDYSAGVMEDGTIA